jgi:hypothetical protein
MHGYNIDKRWSTSVRGPSKLYGWSSLVAWSLWSLPIIMLCCVWSHKKASPPIKSRVSNNSKLRLKYTKCSPDILSTRLLTWSKVRLRRTLGIGDCLHKCRPPRIDAIGWVLPFGTLSCRLSSQDAGHYGIKETIIFLIKWGHQLTLAWSNYYFVILHRARPSLKEGMQAWLYIMSIYIPLTIWRCITPPFVITQHPLNDTVGSPTVFLWKRYYSLVYGWPLIS